MKKLLFIVLLFCTQFLVAQNKKLEDLIEKAQQAEPPKDADSSNLKTVVMSIDLSYPTSKSVKLSNGRKRLSFENNQLLQVELVNGNPYKYSYVINYKTINLFSEIDSNFLRPQPNTVEENETLTANFTGNNVTVQDIITAQTKLSDSIQAFDLNLLRYNEVLMSSEVLDVDLHNDIRIILRKKYSAIIENLSIIEEEAKKLTPVSNGVNNNILQLKTKLESIKPLYLKIIQSVSSTYLLPIDVFGDNVDYVEVTLERYQGTTRIDEYTYKIWITGGVKIDFSAGAFITSLISNSYSATAITRTNGEGTEETGYIITEDNIGNYNLGFGPMANIVWRTGSYLKPALNVGTLLTSDLDFQILVGGGLVIGKKERFIFHTGLSMGAVDELKNTYKLDTFTSGQLNDPTAIPTIETFKFGYFFGVTYNFDASKKN